MKRVIIIAAFLWMLLILLSYRLTAQDSVTVYVVSVKSTVTQFNVKKKVPATDFNKFFISYYLKYDSLYYIKSSAFVEYTPCGVFCYSIFTPAPASLSATAKRSAFVLF